MSGPERTVPPQCSAAPAVHRQPTPQLPPGTMSCHVNARASLGITCANLYLHIFYASTCSAARAVQYLRFCSKFDCATVHFDSIQSDSIQCAQSSSSATSAPLAGPPPPQRSLSSRLTRYLFLLVMCCLVLTCCLPPVLLRTCVFGTLCLLRLQRSPPLVN